MVKKQEANLVTRFIHEVLISQLNIPLKQILNDICFSQYTGNKRSDLLISEEEYSNVEDSERFIKNLVAYAEVKDGAVINDKNWEDAKNQAIDKSKRLELPFFIITNCKTSIFYNSKNLEELRLNNNPIREFQSIDIFRLIKNQLKEDPNKTNIVTNIDSVSTIVEAIFNKKLWDLANIYRSISFKNNVEKIDFTIGFITLEYYEEKLKQEKKIRQDKFYWSDCTKGNSLRGDLKDYIDNIINDENNFKEFENLIRLVKSYISDTKKISDKNLKEIYDTINSMAPLHGCGFDLFGSVYEAFASKKEKEDFGEYFTRRNYTHIFSKLLLQSEKSFNPNKKFKILDLACGTGGFLTEAFKVLQSNYDKSKTLSNEAINFLSQECFYGIDIREENISRTKLNMFLIGDGHTNIISDNSLTRNHNTKFDYILTNPPYGKGTIKANTDNSSNSRRQEIAFLFKIISLLEIGGKACVILPDGVLENPSNKEIRKEFLEKCNITSIISLPKFAFAPYTKEKTYAIFFEKRSEKASPIQKLDIWMYIIDNDGFANSDKRFPTRLRNNKNGWMHDEISGWVSITGEEKEGLLEIRYNNKFDDSLTDGTEWINEKGVPLKLRKGGNIKIAHILKNMFFSFLPETYLRNINESIENIDNKLAVKEIFNCMGGNQDITEFFIYNHLQNKGKPFKVLSSAIEDDTQMGKIRLTEAEREKFKIFEDKAGIHVTRLGKAGSMSVLEKDDYITTDKAYILYLKSNFKNEYNIKTEEQEMEFYNWFIKNYSELVSEFKTNSDNGSWNKTLFFNNAYISIKDFFDNEESSANKLLFDNLINRASQPLK